MTRASVKVTGKIATDGWASLSIVRALPRDVHYILVSGESHPNVTVP